MICINCFHGKTSVLNSRRNKASPVVWRRRKCQACNKIFTSYETPALDSSMVLQRDNTSTPFSIGKLIISIANSFKHDKHGAEYDSYDLAKTAEQSLLSSGKPLSADDITAITHDILRRFDPVAAIQYAAQHDLVILKRRPGRPSTSYL